MFLTAIYFIQLDTSWIFKIVTGGNLYLMM